MTKFNKILVSLFAAQILLAGALYLSSQPPAADSLQTALLSTDKSQINRITIENGDGKKAVISKVSDQWQLPDYHDLPANQTKVSAALDKLAQTKSGWPIATTQGSHQRFEVDENKYKTRITLANGDKVLEKLYLGTSPGFRQLHVRKDGQDEVYSVRLNDFDYPVTDDSWLNHKLISADNDIAMVSGPDFELSKQGDEWKTTGDGVEVVQEEAKKLATALTSLNVNIAVTKELKKPDYQLKVNTAGQVHEYAFYTDDNNHYVKRDDYLLAFEISKNDFDKITGKTAVQLVKQISDEDSKTVADKQDSKNGKHS
jgi:hypothetical protein